MFNININNNIRVINMDKLKKVGLTTLGTALVASSASAGSLSVSGTAQLTFTGQKCR